MNAAKTIAASTLSEIRREMAADSVLFGEQLLAETDLDDTAGFSDLFMAACGGNAASRECYQLGLEYIFEGYLLHYGQNRLLKPDENDFYLLAGDYMYARGLNAIAGLEDLACVRKLAELIRVCSFIHCENRDPVLAMNAWAVTTLQLAARASGYGGDRPDSSRLDEILPDGSDPDGAALDAAYEESLALFPEEERPALRQIYGDLTTNFLMET